jgi:hypothetical protein
MALDGGASFGCFLESNRIDRVHVSHHQIHREPERLGLAQPRIGSYDEAGGRKARRQ